MSFDLHTGGIVPLKSLLGDLGTNGDTPATATSGVATAERSRALEAAPVAAAEPVPAQRTARSAVPAPPLRPNRVQWRGWIDSEPEVRRSHSGMDFCAVRVAQQVLNTQRQLMSQAVDVVVFQAAARDFVATYRKGDFIEVNGEFRIRQWRDKHGKEHVTVNLHPSEEIALISRLQHGA